MQAVARSQTNEWMRQYHLLETIQNHIALARSRLHLNATFSLKVNARIWWETFFLQNKNKTLTRFENAQGLVMISIVSKQRAPVKVKLKAVRLFF